MEIITGKRTKRRSLESHTECHAETKNESIYFSLFTLYFWLARKKKKEAVQRPLFLPFFFKRFKNGPSKCPGSAEKKQKERKAQ